MDDYRLYLEEKFIGVGKLMNAQFETVHERLDNIEKQTTKTNARVSKLEDTEDEVKGLIITHANTCPSANKIEKIENDLQEYNLIKKYPKIVLILISVVVLFILMSGYQVMEKVTIRKQTIEQNEKLLFEYQKLIQSVDSLQKK